MVCDDGTERLEHDPETDVLIVAPPFKLGHAFRTTLPSMVALDANVVGPPTVTLPVLENDPINVRAPVPDVVIAPAIESDGPMLAPDERTTPNVTPLGIVALVHEAPDAHPAFSVIAAVAVIVGQVKNVTPLWNVTAPARLTVLPLKLATAPPNVTE